MEAHGLSLRHSIYIIVCHGEVFLMVEFSCVFAPEAKIGRKSRKRIRPSPESSWVGESLPMFWSWKNVSASRALGALRLAHCAFAKLQILGRGRRSTGSLPRLLMFDFWKLPSYKFGTLADLCLDHGSKTTLAKFRATLLSTRAPGEIPKFFLGTIRLLTCHYGGHLPAHTQTLL